MIYLLVLIYVTFSFSEFYLLSGVGLSLLSIMSIHYLFFLLIPLISVIFSKKKLSPTPDDEDGFEFIKQFSKKDTP